ncbi:MAG TPA: DUF1501 domain-containing protein [Terriglobia bacterium]|nr:DUF1501 domain-containing protein [Terriglobia bacterium]
MFGQEKYERLLQRRPHTGRFYDRPHWTRRRFMELMGAGVTASFLPQRGWTADLEVIERAAVTTQNRAKNVIYILFNGGMTHVDTFDLKVYNGVTPATFNPTMIGGINWPVGLMPKLANHLPKMSIVRSIRAWAAVHQLARRWQQIGRNPAAVLGYVAPHIGSVVALEKGGDRQPNQVFPTFLSVTNNVSGQGYFPATTAPFKVNAGATSLPNTTSSFGQARFEQAFAGLHLLDDSLRITSPFSTKMEDMDDFYAQAKGLMYNPAVTQAFTLSTTDRARYGNTGFGNSCLLAKQILQSNQGTRFIQLDIAGWDMHSNIYAANSLPARTLELDNGVSELLADLEATGLLNETLVVMMGEFGRTVNNVNGAGGRDHHLQQFCVFAGAGTRGGRAIGATDATGNNVAESGWSRGRTIRMEDVEATIYSALGIDWTTVRYDDPLKRGFEYVPFGPADVYGPINELWI